MSMHHIEQIKCPKCGKDADFEIWNSINVDLNPEMREKVLDGTLYDFKCQHCGHENKIAYPILYNDMTHNFMIYYCDESGVKECEEALTNIMNDELAKEITKDARYRIVTNYFQLAEKIKIFESGFDDRMIELLKLDQIITCNKNKPENHLAFAIFDLIVNPHAKKKGPVPTLIFFNEEAEHVFDFDLSIIPGAIGKYFKDNYSSELIQETTKSENEERKYLFIIDEINRGELSKIFGELFYNIDPGYRGVDGKISTQYQNLVDDNDPFYEGFYIPENVYIIGTMNDINRSVESMDFAFRRRFTFKEITAADTQENILSGDKGLSSSIYEEAITRMNYLNESMKDIEGLSSAYHIGGAYFLKLKELNNSFDLLWKYHLEGLLREYLRGTEDAEENLEKLHKAYNVSSGDNS